jgi:hypothetical protein
MRNELLTFVLIGAGTVGDASMHRPDRIGMSDWCRRKCDPQDRNYQYTPSCQLFEQHRRLIWTASLF